MRGGGQCLCTGLPLLLESIIVKSKTLAATCFAAWAALTGFYFIGGVGGCASLFDKAPYEQSQPGPVAVNAQRTAAAATAGAGVAAGVAAIAAPMNPAVSAGAGLAAGVLERYPGELSARLDEVNARIADLQAHGINVTKGQAETENLVAMLGAVAAAFGFGRYHAKSGIGDLAGKEKSE